MTSTYCNQRWCNICNSIRTSKLIEWYAPQLNKLAEPYFITLSRPNVNAENLKSEVSHYVSTVQKICKHVNKYVDKVHGMRKFECTFNMQVTSFHPHFHMVVSGQHVAETILDMWLEANPTAIREKGNQIKACYDGIDKKTGEIIPWSKELFKYFTKLTVKTGMRKKVKDKQTGKDKFVPIETNIPAWALDVMLQAVSKRRIFQSHGKLIKTIDENIKVDESLKTDCIDLETGEQQQNEWFYDVNRYDWVNPVTSEVLSGYKPLKQLILLESYNLEFYAKQFKCVSKLLEESKISCLRVEKKYLQIDYRGYGKLIKEKARKRRIADVDKLL